MPTKKVYVDVDVELDISDFSDEAILEEMEERGFSVIETGERYFYENTLEEIFQLKRNGKAYSHRVDELIYKVLGRVV